MGGAASASLEQPAQIQPLQLRRSPQERLQRRSLAPRRRHGWQWLCSWALSRSSSLAVAAVLVAVALSGQAGPIAQLARMLASAAALAESSSAAASTIVDAGNNLTQVVSTSVLGAAQNSLSLAHDVWKGVDLSKLVVQTRSGHMLSADAELAARWLLSPKGRAAVPLPADFAAIAADVTAAVCLSFPMMERTEATLRLAGVYDSFAVRAALLPSGYVDIRWRWSQVTYSAQWSNPLWDALEMNIEVENEQVVGRIRDTLAAAQPLVQQFNDTDVSTVEASLPRMFTSKAMLWGRLAWLLLRRVVANILAWPLSL